MTAEWLAGGRRLPISRSSEPGPVVLAEEAKLEPKTKRPVHAAGPTVNELILAYWQHAEKHYGGADRRPTQELENMRNALRPLHKLYGSTPVADFGPLALRTIQQSLARSNLCRTTINARVNRIRRVFKWAVGVEMVLPSVLQALQAVPGLQKGRTDAREPEEIKPVLIERVETTLLHLNPVVAAMVRIQLLTGCRAKEVMNMRGCDLTPGEPNWEYRPALHKTAWRGKDRVIVLGPRAQEIVKRFLKPDPQAYLFDPREVVSAHHAERTQKRASKPTPSEIAKRCKTRPGRFHADHYDRRTYRQAIVRACDRAFPHPLLSGLKLADLTTDQRRELEDWRRKHRWSPLQLRHAAATLIRARYGLEASQVVLGHVKADVTQIYAARDLAKAHSVMAEIG